ncbi:MAG: nucleotide exchange factor GrpE [Acidimicrobiia bacterium]|nr:nucleotide exchange factor GrpE [Acidimicrobiia bacterium]
MTEPVEGRPQEGAPDDSRLDLEIPEDPDQAIELLVNEVADARAESEGHLNDLKRVAAEFDNFRKRVIREQGESASRGVGRVVRSLLPALDTFDAALNVEVTTPTEVKLLGGLENTHAQLLQTLKEEGLEVIPAEPGAPFDPEIHEAVMTTPGDPLVIVEELRRGYRLGDRVVRASLVALGPADQAKETEGSDGVQGGQDK